MNYLTLLDRQKGITQNLFCLTLSMKKMFYAPKLLREALENCAYKVT